MGKNRKHNKKESVNKVFKVSENRAKKAKKNKANIKFKKFKSKTNEEVEQLNKSLNDMQSAVRNAKPKQDFKTNARIGRKQTMNVDINETIDGFSQL